MSKQYKLKTVTTPSRPRSELLRGAGVRSSAVPPSVAPGGDYLTRAEFDRLFDVVTITEADPEAGIEAVEAIRAKLSGFYTDGWLSGFGPAPSDGEGGSDDEPTPGSGLTDDDLETILAWLSESDYATRGWVRAQGYLTESDLPPITPVDLSLYLTTTAADSKYARKIDLSGVGLDWDDTTNDLILANPGGDTSRLSIPYAAASGSASTAEKAGRLSQARTLWGRSFDGSENISGALSGTGNIMPEQSGASDIGSADLYYNTLYLHQLIGVGELNGVMADYLTANTCLQIGSAMLVYDAAHNAIRVQNANFYADNNLSAFGPA